MLGKRSSCSIACRINFCLTNASKGFSTKFQIVLVVPLRMFIEMIVWWEGRVGIEDEFRVEGCW